MISFFILKSSKVNSRQPGGKNVQIAGGLHTMSARDVRIMRQKLQVLRAIFANSAQHFNRFF